jgi:hypothetical protein
MAQPAIEWVWSTQATSGRAMWIVLGIANPPLLTSVSEASTLLPLPSTLTSDDAVISSNRRP